MRFSAFQGGAAGRITPISLAPELRTILTQEGFDTWHDSGGVIMSNALGVPAIRRFYSATAPDFFSRRVALDAFLAGNDLLFLSNFSLDDRWETQRANIKQTIGFFQDRYKNDTDFASRVDDSVRRILRLKLGLYHDALVTPATESAPESNGALPPVIPLSQVMATETSLEVLSGAPRAEADALMGQVARAGVTILYPDPATQTEPLPPVFRTDDHILIFSDSRLQRECQTCTAEAAIGPDQLADIIKRLYGSEATGQIDAELVTSLTFADLTMFLDGQEAATVPATPSSAPTLIVTPTVPSLPTPTPLVPTPDLGGPIDPVQPTGVSDRNSKTAALINEADWIIFAMLNVEPAVYPASDAVGRFLRQYDSQLADQKLVVLALNAPYFLDATEMSRLNTYFGVYSKTQPFLESAVRALFRAFTVVGAPPVAVPGTRFSSLPERLSADPARTLPLRVTDDDDAVIAENSAAGEATDTPPPLDVGATIRLSVGPVIDHNGHPVPDGTPVNFQLQFEGEVLALAVDPALTRSGSATRDVVVERAGTLRVAATAGQATTGAPLAVVIAPPPTPTAAPTVPGTVTTSAVGGGEDAGRQPLPERVNLVTLIIALFTILVTLSLFLILQVRVLPRATLVHNMLWAAIFGLAGYVLYGLGFFPGANWLRANVSVWGTTVVVFVPMLLPLLWLELRGEDR